MQPYEFIGHQLVYTPPPDDLLLKDAHPAGIMWYFFSLSKGYALLIATGEGLTDPAPL
jgi:hypothetical protein